MSRVKKESEYLLVNKIKEKISNQIDLASGNSDLFSIIEIMPIIQKLIPLDCMLGLTDKEKFIKYVPGKKIDIQLCEGTPVRKGDAIYESLKTGRKTILHVKEEIYGVPFQAVGVPIRDKKNKLIGSIGIGFQTIINDLSLDQSNRAILDKRSSLKLSEQLFIFHSSIMKRLLELMIRVAKIDSTVLITGESGVGKGIFASLIHHNSNRSKKPFMGINCGAIPENLMESELFGYEPGSFTGAKASGKAGIFEMCNNGTILLDEIGELPLHLQVKLLRVIQEQEIFRVGDTSPRKLNVRIIAVTNKNLEEMVKNKLFRADLYYRVNVLPIHIPPIRERIEDIMPLASHFLEIFNREYKTNKKLNISVLKTFEKYQWPGNVRELKNLIERLVIISETEVIGLQHLPPDFLIQLKRK